MPGQRYLRHKRRKSYVVTILTKDWFEKIVCYDNQLTYVNSTALNIYFMYQPSTSYWIFCPPLWQKPKIEQQSPHSRNATASHAGPRRGEQLPHWQMSPLSVIGPEMLTYPLFNLFTT